MTKIEPGKSWQRGEKLFPTVGTISATTSWRENVLGEEQRAGHTHNHPGQIWGLGFDPKDNKYPLENIKQNIDMIWFGYQRLLWQTSFPGRKPNWANYTTLSLKTVKSSGKIIFKKSL